jgi:glyoxylase-like metal-dependent hydrolase (beta-lactamase superfamily II)
MEHLDPHAAARRRFIRSAGALGAAAWLAPRGLLGDDALPEVRSRGADGPVQQLRRAAAADPIRVQRLRGNVSVLSGSGGNIAALTSEDGVVLVDAGIVGPKVAGAVATISRAPLTHVINTHWHFDHTDANAWLHARGAAIVAHQKTRQRLAVDTRVEGWDFTFPASPAGALPATVVADERTLRLHGSEVRIAPYAPAHTDSDLSVHLVDANVLHVADTWWNGAYPFIDYSTGGSVDGTIRAAEEGLARGSADTIFVPGHGAAGGRGDVARFRDMMLAVRDRVASLKASGRSVAEVVAAKPTAAYDAGWTGGPIGPDFFTRLVYQGV